MSNFEDLYKNTDRLASHQLERRRQQLEQQKTQRQANLDGHRMIVEQVRRFQEKNQTLIRKNDFSIHREIFFKNKLQLSEWMYQRPEDLENWILVPCPKGTRCLLVADSGRTQAIGKRGNLLLSFPSVLPGGGINKGRCTTIIDTFFDRTNNCFYAIDILAYGNQNYINCECEFRFFWLKTKIQEDTLDVARRNNPYPIKSVPCVNFTDPEGIDSCLSRYPMWDNNTPKLDGLLFYHKESHYVHRETPLVLWLYPFMVPEVLGIHSVNEEYLREKPKDYVDYLNYIESFNVKQRQKEDKRKKNRRQKSGPMEIEVAEGEGKSTGGKSECMDHIESETKDDSDNDQQKVDQEMFLLETQ